MTKVIKVANNWGDIYTEDIESIVELFYSAKDAGVFAAKYPEMMLNFLFTIAPKWMAAIGQSNTKDRRDALRALFDEANMLIGREGTGFSLDPAVAPSVRNKLTQANLQAAAAGLYPLSGLPGMFESKPSPSEANEAITNGTLSETSFLTAAQEILKNIKPTGKPNMLAITYEDGAVIAVDPVAGTDASTTTTTSKKESTTMTTIVSNEAVRNALATDAFTRVDGAVAAIVDGTLKQLGLPGVHDIGAALKELNEKAAKGATAEGMKIVIGEGMEFKSASATIPSGKAVTKKAKDLFGVPAAAAKLFDFDVPFYEWDAAHPHVPAIDPNYQFQPDQLLKVLLAIVTNQRAWLYGDTGCGKTTVIEQAAARMNYPVIRVNFDSEVTRMDLIGAKDIVVSGGHPVTEFTEGVLPSAMQQPCLFLADELDFIRADVAYVFQRALEGNGLTIPEDGGRIVHPHPGFRIIATANTQGQGDESGRYQGAKPQSAAFLDRFTIWIGCEYMTADQVKELISRKFPSIDSKIVQQLSGYAREHWTAFKNGQVLTALSPRGLLSCAMTYTVFSGLMDEKKALLKAMEATFLHRASVEDQATIKGLISRVMA